MLRNLGFKVLKNGRPWKYIYFFNAMTRLSLSNSKLAVTHNKGGKGENWKELTI